jgi:hypothetical protein
MSNSRQVRNAGCLATSARRRNAELAAIAAEEAVFQDNLLRLRAVLILLSTPHGRKVATAGALLKELKRARLALSLRSLYRWRSRYLRFGFAGMLRRRRRDAGQPHGFSQETLARIVHAAVRVKRYGDLARSFRALRPGICAEAFRLWIRRIQRELRVRQIRQGGAD